MDWQPIESAPKDGTEILVWYRLGDFDKVACVQWADKIFGHVSGWIVSVEWLNPANHGQRTFLGAPPTHWMPLPEPPKSEG